MKTITFSEFNRSDDLLHIELPGGIINIRVNLHDTSCNRVTHIELLPDKNSKERWMLDGHVNNRFIESELDKEK